MPRKRVQRVVVRYKKKSVMKKRFKKTAIFFIIIAVLGGIFYASAKKIPPMMERSKFLKIWEVAVAGVEDDKLAVIESHMSSWKSASVFKLNRKFIGEELRNNFPEYKLAKCSYSLSGKLNVVLEKRLAVAFTRQDGNDYGVDGEGLYFHSEDYAGLPEIVFYDEEGKNRIIGFLKSCAKEGLNTLMPIKKVYMKDFGEMELFLEDGTKVAWGYYEADLEKNRDKFERLNTVLKHALQKFGKLKYVNLRYLDDGRILVRPETKLLKS